MTFAARRAEVVLGIPSDLEQAIASGREKNLSSRKGLSAVAF